MKHRHLDLAPDTPIEALPSAALHDRLDRGDLADWGPVLDAIARDPAGAVAQRVMELLDHFPMYGTSPLLRAWIDRERAAARRAGPRGEPLRLHELRLRAGLTQARLSKRMGMSQSDLSKLERRVDVRLSTLRSYARALGGDLALLARTAQGAVRIRLRPHQRRQPGPRSQPDRS